MSFLGVTKKWAQPKRITRDGPKLCSQKAEKSTATSDCNLRTHEDSSATLNTEQLRLFVGTWNVGGRAPTEETRESVQEWLIEPHSPNQPPDIYVLGFQEIVPLNVGNVLRGDKEEGSNGGILASDTWEALISETLNQSSKQTQTIDACCNTKHNKDGVLSSGSMKMFTPQTTQNLHVRDDGNDNNKKPKHRSQQGNAQNNDFSCDTQHTSKDRMSNASLIDQDDTYYVITPSNKVRTCDDILEFQEDEEIKNSFIYTRIARRRMVGLFITIWVRWNLRRHIKNVQVSSVGCGIMNRLGNKGSVSVSLSVHGTSFCFICSHLRSGQRSNDAIRRNVDVETILHRTRFPYFEKLNVDSSFQLPTSILAHDRIILLGDLNYRLNIASRELKALLLQQDWQILFEKDELKDATSTGGVLEGWHEGSICFGPTYKYLINSDIYWMEKEKEGSSKRRSPAWCDRILWHGKGLKQLSYTRCESKHSDHRPVRSTFEVEVEVLTNTSTLNANQLENQGFTPFLEEVKELLCTTGCMMLKTTRS